MLKIVARCFNRTPAHPRSSRGKNNCSGIAICVPRFVVYGHNEFVLSRKMVGSKPYSILAVGGNYCASVCACVRRSSFGGMG